MTEPLLAGRYRLDRLLHSGPAHDVWAATDTAMGRAVAVKVTRPAGHPAATDALGAEARLRARVDSPYLPSLYEHGADPPHLVTQLVTGGDLAGWSALSGPLTPAAAAGVGAAVASALGDLHRSGAAHGRLDATHVLLREPAVDLRPGAGVPHVYLVGLGEASATAAGDLVNLGELVRGCLHPRASYDGPAAPVLAVADAAVSAGRAGGTDVEPLRRRFAALAPSSSAPVAAGRAGARVAATVAVVLVAALAVGGWWWWGTSHDGSDPAAGEPSGAAGPGALPGDLDGDGRGDVVLYRVDGLRVETAVLRSEGSAFAPPEVSTQPGALVLTGDLDGDGRADVFRAIGGAGGGLEVQLATGGRRLAASPPLTEDFSPRLADMDGDGRDDVVVANAVGDLPLTLAVGPTEDDGTPGDVSDVALPRLDAGFLTLADVDGDGSAEVLHLAPDRLTEGALALTVLDGDPEGGYAPAGATTLVDVALEVTAAGDVDGDGDEEVVVRRSEDDDRSGLVVLDAAEGDGDLVLEEREVLAGDFAAQDATAPYRPLVLDVDGDGRGDLVQPLLQEDRVALSVLRSTPDGFSPPTTWGAWECDGSCEGVLAAGPNR